MFAYFKSFAIPSIESSNSHLTILAIVLALWAVAIAIVIKLAERVPLSEFYTYKLKIIDKKAFRFNVEIEIPYIFVIGIVAFCCFWTQLVAVMQIIFKNSSSQLIEYGDILLICSLQVLITVIFVFFVTASYLVHNAYLHNKKASALCS